RPPTPERPAPFTREEVAPGRPYGAGKQELLPLLGESASSTGGVLELGVRGGGVVGRLDWLALGASRGCWRPPVVRSRGASRGWRAGRSGGRVLAGMAGRGWLPPLPLGGTPHQRGGGGPARRPPRPRPPGDRALRLPGLAMERRGPEPRRPGALGSGEPHVSER